MTYNTNYMNDYAQNQNQTIRKFYAHSSFNNFENINKEKIDVIREKSLKNKNYINNKYNNYSSLHKYTRMIEMLLTNKKAFELKNDEERLLFILFSIDPELEMLKIFLAENQTNTIKQKAITKFGFYDPHIIKLEKLYIKFIYTDEEKKEFNEEVEKRVFK